MILPPSNPSKNAIEERKQDRVEYAPPIHRRFVTLWCAFGLYIGFCWLGSRLICAGRYYLGRTIGTIGVGLVIAASVLIVLSGFRWSWGWWW